MRTFIYRLQHDTLPELRFWLLSEPLDSVTLAEVDAGYRFLVEEMKTNACGRADIMREIHDLVLVVFGAEFELHNIGARLPNGHECMVAIR